MAPVSKRGTMVAGITRLFAMNRIIASVEPKYPWINLLVTMVASALILIAAVHGFSFDSFSLIKSVLNFAFFVAFFSIGIWNYRKSHDPIICCEGEFQIRVGGHTRSTIPFSNLIRLTLRNSFTDKVVTVAYRDGEKVKKLSFTPTREFLTAIDRGLLNDKLEESWLY